MLFLPVPIRSLFRSILVLLLLFFLCRLSFLAFNLSLFRSLTVKEILVSFIAGIRYDITAITIGNILFIALHLIPLPSRIFLSKVWQRILSLLFVLINAPLLLLNCIDMGLFSFTGKRANADAVKVISYGEDFSNTVPKMVADYWYLAVIFFVLCWLLFRLRPRATEAATPISLPAKILWYFGVLALTVIGFRGGLQLKPLNVISASRYGDQKMSALILNTPFTVIKSWGKPALQEVRYMDDKMADQTISFVHNGHSMAFRNLNVVVIILESVSREYIGYYNNGKGYTPFLDSLIGKSLSFPNSYANGKRSIEGIPAIVAGIPALSNEPFITSSYSANRITTIATALKQQGYNSTFYHGGTNGTMGFDNFSYSAGFDRYFGRTEYNNDKDFDNNWGIFDEPFLQRTIKEMDGQKQPFLSVIFTLSSHHPYTIPSQYMDDFTPGSLPIHQSIRYADHALQKFFQTAQKTSWYDSTLFVITADHTAMAETPYYQNRAGIYAVPMLFYAPALLGPSVDSMTVSQIDILPSVLDFLKYPDEYFAYGNSVFTKSPEGFAISYLNETYQMIDGEYSLIMEPSGLSTKVYRFSTDQLMTNDISKSYENTMWMQRKLQAFVQKFNKTMIYNKMTIESAEK